MIKAIIFDNIGVFTKKGLSKTLDRFSSEFAFDREKLEPEYKRLAKLANKGEITSNQLYQELIDIFDIDATPAEIRKMHLDSYGEELNLDMYEYAKELSKKYKICLFSNFSDAFDELNERLRLDTVFDPDMIFVSAKLKIKKPEKEAFEYALRKLGCKPEEVLFVDDREDNFVESSKLGIRGIVFKDINQFKEDMGKLEPVEHKGNA